MESGLKKMAWIHEPESMPEALIHLEVNLLTSEVKIGERSLLSPLHQLD